MKLNNITARDNKFNPIDLAMSKYGKRIFDDAIFLDSSFKNILALTGIGSRKPYCLKLINNSILSVYFNDKNSHLIEIMDDEVYDNGTRVNDEIKNEILKSISYLETYGGRLGEHGELIYDIFSEPIGPHYAINLLLGDRKNAKDALQSTPKSVVDHLGRGSFRGQADLQVLATSWTLLMSENGNPVNRQFYLFEKGKQIFYSAGLDKNIKKGTCYHYPNKTIIEYELEAKLIVRRTIFILPQLKDAPEAVECQTIDIINLTSKTREIKIVCTGMFGTVVPDNQKTDILYANVITQSSIIKDENDNTIALAPNYYPLYSRDASRFVIMKDDKGYIDSFSTNYEEFFGNGDLSHPENAITLSNIISIKGPNFFALGKELKIGPKKSTSIDTFVGVTMIKDPKNDIQELNMSLNALLTRIPNHKKLLKIIEEKDNDFNKYRNFLQVKTSNPTFDNFVNYNLPFQVKYQTFVSRAFAMTQKGYREIGFREIQDIYASMYYLYNSGKKVELKNLLTQWIENVYKMGYANHNFFYKGKEPGMCSDDQIWLILAVYRYVQLSGDTDILNERFLVAGSTKKRKLKDTILAIIQYSGEISIGKHNLPLLDSADWNDCLKIDPDYLDGPIKEANYLKQIKVRKVPYGSRWENDYSESVMNAFLLSIALDNALVLFKDDEDSVNYIAKIKDRLVSSIKKHAYINSFYSRVLINRPNANNISYVGSKGDKLSINPECDGAYYLNSFSWSLLSNVASEEEIKEMLPIVEKYLKTPSGFRLCSEHDLSLCGAKSSATDHYFIGDRENGGVFKHATMMLVVGLLQAARNVKDSSLKKSLLDNAYYMLDIVMPFRTYEDIQKYKGNPRFCTQYNNSLTEENIGPMLSGTATWLTLALYEIIGISFIDNGFRINPSLRYEESHFEAKIKHLNSIFSIIINKTPNSVGKNDYDIFVDGKPHTGPIYPDGNNHTIVINY